MKAHPIFPIFLLLISIIFPARLFAQNHTLQGFVKDAKTGEPLIGATVFQPASQKGTSTDNNGYFRLTTSTKATFEISFIGYQKLLFTSPAQNDSLVNLYLAPGLSIGEVKIEAKYAEERVTGLVEIPIDLLKKLPTMTGEPDLMKSFQLMPGVKMGDEGTSVFYVRGGTPDQNLIIMDDVPIYYVNHIGGFLSVFDMNTIKKATLYKGDFPPRFGGRLSSVLDIRLKDGNVKQTKHEIGIGTLSSKYFVEGPILKNKLSGMFSLRRCNLDLYMRPLTEMNSCGNDVRSYSFYDLTAKATYSKDARNKFSFMAYSGRDKLFLKEKFADNYLDKMNNRWGNRIGSAKWTHFAKNSWVATSGVSYSRFFKLISTIEKEASQNDVNKTVGSFGSNIQDFSMFSSVNRPFNKLDLRLGLSSMFHQFTPTTIKSSGGNNSFEEDTLFINRLHETELNGYLETDWDISKKLQITSGFFAMYWFGIDHASVDPRLSVNYSLPKQTAIKASYSKNHQYIHLLSNNSAGLPNDLWVPSTSTIQPEKSD